MTRAAGVTKVTAHQLESPMRRLAPLSPALFVALALAAADGLEINDEAWAQI